MPKALCPGSFDPLTYGHLDVIERAARVFEQVYVTIFQNDAKAPLFTVEERLEMCREAVAHLPNVTVDAYHGLLVEYARKQGVGIVVKGLRAVSDFEYEFQMAQMNRRLDAELETFFIIARPEHAYLSSSIVKTIARFGGSVSGLVPPHVESRLLGKFGRSV
ncbi:MAG: pantetheine-phosphate adenylyltransferase [Clostridia bacterium]|nr:pantetheine-phosphate adenylyltransferase [Clostridia bacterium]MCL6522752.1 pantetheine-phosphate adenylyltransferase [Bacillota bacterium]